MKALMSALVPSRRQAVRRFVGGFYLVMAGISAGARVGWAGVLLFHVLLMSFGPGTWLWCLPVLAILAPIARADWWSLGPGVPGPAATVAHTIRDLRP